MKFRSISHWNSDPQLEGLLFFAQLIDEMLFDYSLDTYKSPALNTNSLCYEALQIISLINDGFLDKNNLKPILEELAWSLDSDIISKKLIGTKYVHIKEKLIEKNYNISEIKTLIEIILNIFKEEKYLNEIKEHLISAVQFPNKKKEIIILSKLFIPELINNGFHPTFIYNIVNRYFFDNSSNKIISVNQINQFLQYFQLKEETFSVVFRGYKLFNELTNVLNKADIIVEKKCPMFTSGSFEKQFCQNSTTDDVFLICSKVEALDHASARENAQTRIENISNLFNFYHHKQRMIVSDDALIVRDSDKLTLILDQPTRSILKTRDIKPLVASKYLNKLVSKFSLDSNSMYRFFRAVDLHSVALESTAVENQLLNLWSALETLIPKDPNKEESKIVNISRSLVPFLQNNYFIKLVKNLVNDIIGWDRKYAENLIKKVRKDANVGLVECVVKLLVLPEYESLRKQLYALLDKYPLLRYRIFELSESLKKGKSAYDLVEMHTRRIEWHIRRIYRSRNMIIHSGIVPPYTSVLVENIHSYLDILLEQIIYLSAGKKLVNSIEQAILVTQMITEIHLKELKKYSSALCTSSNYKTIIYTNS